MRLSTPPGVLGLLFSAGSTNKDERFTFYLEGDLGQMSAQGMFLRNHGFEVGRSDVYPLLKEEDVARALKLVFDCRIEGYWQYKNKFVELKICTADEFDKALSITVEQRKKSNEK